MFMLGAKTTARIRAFTQPRRERGEQERDIAREKNKVKKTSLKKGNKRSKWVPVEECKSFIQFLNLVRVNGLRNSDGGPFQRTAPE